MIIKPDTKDIEDDEELGGTEPEESWFHATKRVLRQIKRVIEGYGALDLKNLPEAERARAREGLMQARDMANQIFEAIKNRAKQQAPEEQESEEQGSSDSGGVTSRRGAD